MKSVKAEELSVETFLPFGFYANMLDPDAEKIGKEPIEFYRDMAQQDLGGKAIVSFSTCRVEKRALVVDVTEYHTATGEGCLPLDNDILIHVGPASPGAVPPLDKIRVFRVPQGTMVVIRPGRCPPTRSANWPARTTAWRSMIPMAYPRPSCVTPTSTDPTSTRPTPTAESLANSSMPRSMAALCLSTGTGTTPGTTPSSMMPWT